MKKKTLTAIISILLVLALTACSAKSGGAADTMQYSAVQNAPEAADYSMSWNSTAKDSDAYGVSKPQEMPDTADIAPEGSPYVLTDAKIIRRAVLRMQTTEFDAATAALDRLVGAQGGYYEESEIRQGTYYSRGYSRSGHYVVRVPKENYAAFLSAVGDVGYLVSKGESVENVGETYYDIESRLKTQQSKHERLLELLEEAETMEEIVYLESALSDTEYMIEKYTGSLRRYDALIDYSTITIDLEEVVKITENEPESPSLAVRIGRAFTSGLRNAGEALGNFAVWLAYNLIGLLIFFAVAAAVIVLLVRLIRHRKQANKAGKVHGRKNRKEKDLTEAEEAQNGEKQE